MSTLTSLLVRDQVVPARIIEDALQRQVVSGGSIETVLLEMGAVPEDVLSAYAAAAVGLRPATRDALMNAPRDVIRLLPREVAERHRIVPIAVEGRTLKVASLAPLPPEVEQQIGFLLGLAVETLGVVEVRLSAALGRHYGVEPSGRFARLADKLDLRDPGVAPVYVAPPAPLVRGTEHNVVAPRRVYSAFDDEEDDEDAADDRAPAPASVPPFVTSGATASDASAAGDSPEFSPKGTPSRTFPGAARPKWGAAGDAATTDVARFATQGAPPTPAAIDAFAGEGRDTLPFGVPLPSRTPGRGPAVAPSPSASGAAAPPAPTEPESTIRSAQETRPEHTPWGESEEVPTAATAPGAIAGDAATFATFDEVPRESPARYEVSAEHAFAAPPSPPSAPSAPLPPVPPSAPSPPSPDVPAAASERASTSGEAASAAPSAPDAERWTRPEPRWSASPAASASSDASSTPHRAVAPTPALPTAVSALLSALSGQPAAPGARPSGLPASGVDASAGTADAPPPGGRPEFLRRLRGPIVARAAAELLEQAASRDEVMAVFFAFARQFFDWTALFVVIDDVAEGREAAGAGVTAAEVERIAFPLDAGGLLSQVRAEGVGRVATLDAHPRDRALAERLRRPTGWPLAVLPLTLRRRVVLLLLGDRSGDAFGLEDLPELLAILPRVSEAFERLIVQRKRGGVGPTRGSVAAPPARASATATRDDGLPAVQAPSTPEPAASPAGSPSPSRAAPEPTGREMHARSAERDTLVDPFPVPSALATREDAPPIVPARDRRTHGALSVLGVPRSAPPPPMPPRGIRSPSHVRLPAAPAAVGQARVQEPGPPAGSGESRAPADDAPSATSVPDREGTPSASPTVRDEDDAEVSISVGAGADEADFDEDLENVEVAERASRPTGGAPHEDTSYVLRGAGHDDVLGGERPLRSSSPPRRAAAPADVGPNAGARPPGRRSSTPPATPAARSRVDPRSEGGAVPTVERVRVTPSASPASQRVREKDTLPDSPFARERRRASAAPPAAEEPSVVVDMGDGIEGLVDELSRMSPDDTSNVLDRVVRLADLALPVIAQRFPGPLWFDRRVAHTRLPRGRDVSPLARALVTLRDRAVAYLPSLLDHRDAEARFYATLVASEVVHPALLGALERRVFDDDPGIRALALDVLKLYQLLPAYADVLEHLRNTARWLNRDVGRRRIAVRALAELRDARAVPILVQLLEDDDTGLRGEAHRALVVLTRQDFGADKRRWEPWLEHNAQRHRIEWLIDALLHPDEPLRAAAGDELKRLTQEYYGYHPASPRRERERVYKKYRQWWETTGRSRFG